MAPLQARTTSVSITTYVATIVVLILWLLITVAGALYLFFHQRKHVQRLQRTSSTARIISPSLPSDPTTPPSYPPRARATSYPPNDPSSLSATTRPTDLSSIRTSPDGNPLKQSTPSISTYSSRLTTASPTVHPVLSALAHSEITQRAFLLTSHPAQTARITQLQAMAPTSDITDMSAETVEPAKEVVNAGYMTMLAQRGLSPRDQALLGSDDSTDAGGGTGVALNYAVHPRGLVSTGGARDRGRNGVSLIGHGGGGRAVTLPRAEVDEELERVSPLCVRKMSSM